MRDQRKAKATADKVIKREAGRLYERLYRAAFLHARNAQHLKPALSQRDRTKLDELDKKLGFQ